MLVQVRSAGCCLCRSLWCLVVVVANAPCKKNAKTLVRLKTLITFVPPC